MTARFDANYDGYKNIVVMYDEDMMCFTAIISVEEAEGLLRDLERAIREAKG